MTDAPARVSASKSLAYLLIVIVIVFDQATKHWSLNALNAGRTIEIFWTLRFNLVFNSGMAFSQGQGLGRIIGLLAIGVVVGLLMSLRKPMSRI